MHPDGECLPVGAGQPADPGLATGCGRPAEDLTDRLDAAGANNPGAHLPFTPSAKQAIERSLQEALHLEHHRIGTEHILLGPLRQDGDTAIQILIALGTDADRVRRQVHESMP